MTDAPLAVQPNDEPADKPEQVLDFWCGPLDASGLAQNEFTTRWWTKDASLDHQIQRRFGALHAQLNAAGPRLGLRTSSALPWLETPQGLVAAVIVLDQFSRNMFRDTPGMFASDPLALSLSMEALALGYDTHLPIAQRSFFYMPFMHSERLACQKRCITLFEHLRDQGPAPARQLLDSMCEYAHSHHDIVARFGRFPHRNRILRRPSTQEELDFLDQPGSSF